MPRRQDIPLPADFIFNASTHLTREDFETAFRKRLPEQAPHLTPRQMDRLFEITCDFRKEDYGVRAIRQRKVISDLEGCEKVIIEARTTLAKFILHFRPSNYRGNPHTAAAATTICSGAAQLSRQLAEELVDEWGRQRRSQARWASKLSLKNLESKFVGEFESCLRTYLRQLSLTGRKRNEYVNSVVASIMLLNDPTRKTDHKDIALSRARQSRYNARQSGNRPVGEGDMSEDEVLPQVKKKKQKEKRRSQK